MGGIHCRGPSSEQGTATFDPTLQHPCPSNSLSDKPSEQTTRVSWLFSPTAFCEPRKGADLHQFDAAKAVDSESAEEGGSWCPAIDLDYRTYVLIRLAAPSKAAYEALKPFAYVALAKAQPLVALRNGAVYFGDTDASLTPQGLGLKLEADLTLLEGNWDAGQLHGKGLLLYPNGDHYTGFFDHGEISGKGKFVHLGGAYEGDWKDSKQHGQGVELWADGSIYEGEFSAGQKQGFGSFHWADKSAYEGSLANSQLDGYGKYTWSDGKSYEGHWVCNQMTGKGVLTYSDGRRYEGEFQAGKRSGYGVLSCSKGKTCSGFWQCGKMQFPRTSD